MEFRVFHRLLASEAEVFYYSFSSVVRSCSKLYEVKSIVLKIITFYQYSQNIYQIISLLLTMNIKHNKVIQTDTVRVIDFPNSFLLSKHIFMLLLHVYI